MNLWSASSVMMRLLEYIVRDDASFGVHRPHPNDWRVGVTMLTSIKLLSHRTQTGLWYDGIDTVNALHSKANGPVCRQAGVRPYNTIKSRTV